MPHPDVELRRAGFMDGQVGYQPRTNAGIPYMRGYLLGTINRLQVRNSISEDRAWLDEVERSVEADAE